MAAVGFVALSGVGWIFDLAMFWALMRWFALPAGPANFVSATIAAVSVFVLSRRLLFGAEGAATRSLVVYFLYTEAGIVLWAVAIQTLAALFVDHGLATDHELAGVAAKIAVTPFSLACNYLVAKYLATRVRGG